MEIQEWYGAKTLYQIHSNTVEKLNKLYEERVIVLKASSFDDAIAEAEEEAKRYANDVSGITFLGYVNIFKLFSENIIDKTEVFSLMRESNLGPNKYIDRYFDTGKERTKKLR
jgi:hypothetical protein